MAADDSQLIAVFLAEGLTLLLNADDCRRVQSAVERANPELGQRMANAINNPDPDWRFDDGAR